MIVALLFVGLISSALAKPGFLHGNAIGILTPGAPIGPDGRVLDTPEVAAAKAEHAAAQFNERLKLANEAIRSSGLRQSNVVVATPNVLVSGAPIGPDGRVVDTPEVAVAKAVHNAAQANERINLANEAVRSLNADFTRPLVPYVTNGIVTPVVPAAIVGPDGRVQDTPEVAAAKAAHAAAQINERINLANEALRSSETMVATQPTVTIPLVANNLIVPGASIGPDGRVQDTPEVAVAKAAHLSAHINEKINLINEAAKSSDILALSGPAFAYRRLFY